MQVCCCHWNISQMLCTGISYIYQLTWSWCYPGKVKLHVNLPWLMLKKVPPDVNGHPSTGSAELYVLYDTSHQTKDKDKHHHNEQINQKALEDFKLVCQGDLTFDSSGETILGDYFIIVLIFYPIFVKCDNTEHLFTFFCSLSKNGCEHSKSVCI